jgi:hypothetical protein
VGIPSDRYDPTQTIYVQLPFNFAKIGMSKENLDPMTSSTDSHIPTSTIERKETGLYISGTRITIYDVLDFAIAQYIANMLNLSLEQVQIALEYIDTHRAEVEAEYRSITIEKDTLKFY